MTRTQTQTRNALRRLNLPIDLVELIESDRLFDAIDCAQATIDALNDELDRWELVNPEAARLAPWFEARQQWKAAGRPQAPWYVLLRSVQRTPFARDELAQYVFSDLDDRYRHRIHTGDRQKWEAFRAKRLKWEVASRRRRAARKRAVAVVDQA